MVAGIAENLLRDLALAAVGVVAACSVRPDIPVVCVRASVGVAGPVNPLPGAHGWMTKPSSWFGKAGVSRGLRSSGFVLLAMEGVSQVDGPDARLLNTWPQK